ncbi:hypothetical protein NH8B_0982 [Pseudogulbenkiania sp. NH8B]|uniref:head-tail joining protein n=1 Tax=Pseudogulbenkiania sp. (strain NH8B) TaxID=748280 RepID=UPI0002279A94|nr:hypothetical protein [Pseudogulbenkiania sp. NH8B]BAK75814.1 hypothetical protein NH8B_0982 [Pseudogulbenkiania sp. NH8B]
MNAFDRLNRSLGRLASDGVMGESVSVDGQPYTGVFHREDGNGVALGFVRGEALKTATLAILLADLGSAVIGEGVAVVADGDNWRVSQPPERRGDGFLTLSLELQP